MIIFPALQKLTHIYLEHEEYEEKKQKRTKLFPSCGWTAVERWAPQTLQMITLVMNMILIRMMRRMMILGY